MTRPVDPHVHRPRLLMVGGWKEVYEKALSLEADLVALDATERLTGLGAGPDRIGIPIAIDDPVACVAAARALDAERPFAAVVSFAELGLRSAAMIGEALNIPANPLRPVALTRDKLLMRRALAAAGLPTVRFRLCRSPHEVAEMLVEIGDAIIIKPVDGAGSRGVARVATQAEVDRAWQWATVDGADAVLAEEFVRGQELSVEAISFDGRHHVVAIAEKLTTGAPHFIETGHQLPARLTADVAAEVGRHVVSLLDAVGQRHGPSHTEVKLAAGGVKIIESQTRTGGDQIWEMVDLALGYDMHRATMSFLLFGQPAAPPSRERAAAIRFLTAEPMTVARIEGIDAARAVPGVVRVRVDAEVGQEVGPLMWSRSRLGFVLALEDRVESAIDRAEEAVSHVNLVPHIEPVQEVRDRTLVMGGADNRRS